MLACPSVPLRKPRRFHGHMRQCVHVAGLGASTWQCAWFRPTRTGSAHVTTCAVLLLLHLHLHLHRHLLAFLPVALADASCLGLTGAGIKRSGCGNGRGTVRVRIRPGAQQATARAAAQQRLFSTRRIHPAFSRGHRHHRRRGRRDDGQRRRPDAHGGNGGRGLLAGHGREHGAHRR